MEHRPPGHHESTGIHPTPLPQVLNLSAPGWAGIRHNGAPFLVLATLHSLTVGAAAAGVWWTTHACSNSTLCETNAIGQTLAWTVLGLVTISTSTSLCRAAFDTVTTGHMNLTQALRSGVSLRATLLVALAALLLVLSLAVPIVGPVIVGAWTLSLAPSYFHRQTTLVDAMREATEIVRGYPNELWVLTFRRYLRILLMSLAAMIAGTALASVFGFGRWSGLSTAAACALACCWVHSAAYLIGASTIYRVLIGEPGPYTQA